MPARNPALLQLSERNQMSDKQIVERNGFSMDRHMAGYCTVCNTAVYSFGGKIVHAHNIPPLAVPHDATLIKAVTESKLAPLTEDAPMDRCHSCGSGPLGNCGYGGAERPRNLCPITASLVGEREGEFESWWNNKYPQMAKTLATVPDVYWDEDNLASLKSCKSRFLSRKADDQTAWNAALASKPSPEGIPERPKPMPIMSGGFIYYATVADPYIDSLLALLSAKDDEMVRITDLVRMMRHELHAEDLISSQEFAALVADSDSGKRVARLETYDFHRKHSEAAESELSALKLSSASVRDETILEIINLYCSRCRSGVPLYEDSRGLLMHRYDANDSRYCDAGMMHRMLIPTSPESEDKVK